MINFCFDKIIDTKNKIVYPNLAPAVSGEFSEIRSGFSQLCPFSDYPRLLEYLVDDELPFGLYSTHDECPSDSFYLVSLNFFNPDIDWFLLMPAHTLQKFRRGELRLLFFYSEADNPMVIRDNLYAQASRHGVSKRQIHYVCQNTVAKDLHGMTYFNDDEVLLKGSQDHAHAQVPWANSLREKRFTLLVRSQKAWRFSAVTKMWNAGLLNDSYVSYNAIGSSNGFEYIEDEVDLNNNRLSKVAGKNGLAKFASIVPFSCDDLSDDDRNSYESFVPEYYANAYWNIVLETHIDLDETLGVFITEKTFKPIRHHQPFIVLGNAGTLKHLRELGYKTFDGFIDERYDLIVNDYERYFAVFEEIKKLRNMSFQELQNLNEEMKPILIHNANLFNSVRRQRLSNLLEELANV